MRGNKLGKKTIWRIAFLLLIGLLALLGRYIHSAASIVNAYGAKIVCSAVYLQHRSVQKIIEEELSAFPFSLATYTLNEKDSSVTGTIWDLAKRKALYRNGLGATLVSDSSERQIRAQHFILPE